MQGPQNSKDFPRYEFSKNPNMQNCFINPTNQINQLLQNNFTRGINDNGFENSSYINIKETNQPQFYILAQPFPMNNLFFFQNIQAQNQFLVPIAKPQNMNYLLLQNPTQNSINNFNVRMPPNLFQYQNIHNQNANFYPSFLQGNKFQRDFQGGM